MNMKSGEKLELVNEFLDRYERHFTVVTLREHANSVRQLRALTQQPGEIAL